MEGGVAEPVPCSPGDDEADVASASPEADDASASPEAEETAPPAAPSGMEAEGTVASRYRIRTEPSVGFARPLFQVVWQCGEGRGALTCSLTFPKG